MRFDVKLDAHAGTVRLSRFGGRASPVVEATFRRDDRKAHLEGTPDGTAFSIDLTRDFPR